MRIFPAFLAALALMTACAVRAGENDLSSIPLKDIDGKPTSLQPYSGKVMLLVNVASQCGFTPQYEGLEALWRKYKDQGLVVLGFPCNDFGAQEPGSNEEIKSFCKSRFDVSFPLFDKLHVLGAEQHPLYAALTGPSSKAPGPITWNFNKFLIGRDGAIISRFDSEVEPGSETLAKAVESALQAK